MPGDGIRRLKGTDYVDVSVRIEIRCVNIMGAFARGIDLVMSETFVTIILVPGNTVGVTGGKEIHIAVGINVRSSDGEGRGHTGRDGLQREVTVPFVPVPADGIRTE